MKTKLRCSINSVTSDVYEWISDGDKVLLCDPKYDFMLVNKLQHWRNVEPSPRLHTPDDIEGFYVGKFSVKSF